MLQCFMLLAHMHRHTHTHTDALINGEMTYRLIEMEIKNTSFWILSQISIEVSLVTGIYGNIVIEADGVIFPDRVTMYMVGIEDRDYKEDKVECKFIFIQN